MLLDIDDNLLESVYVSRTDRIQNLSSSLGNQIKWKVGNRYIKLNCLGYEDIAEVMTTHFLKFTDIPESDYVKYYSCKVYEDGKLLGHGCYSYDFKPEGYSEVTIGYFLDLSFKAYSISYEDLRDYLWGIVGFDIKPYIDRIMCLDSIIRNEDRHFKNISFLEKDGVYIPAPIFDNGSGCMSDLLSYPLSESFNVNYNSIYAKPFYTDFKRNLVDNALIKVDYDAYIKDVNLKEEESVRAFKTLLKGLSDMEGIAWQRC